MITWDGRSRTIVADGRPIQTTGVTPDANGWRARVALASGVLLAVQADRRDVVTAGIALWHRRAERELGVAVVARRGEPVSLKLIPLCVCGDRECGHAGRQLAGCADAPDLLSLIDVLEGLDVVGTLSDDERVWQPRPV
jgi:hypothetical protein